MGNTGACDIVCRSTFQIVTRLLPKWRWWRDCVTLAKETKDEATPRSDSSSEEGLEKYFDDVCKSNKLQSLLTIGACSSTVRAGDS